MLDEPSRQPTLCSFPPNFSISWSTRFHRSNLPIWLGWLEGRKHVIRASKDGWLSVATIRRCDAKRPQCSQCIKSKRVCAGYQREMIFVEAVVVGTRSTPKKPSPASTVFRPETIKALSTSRCKAPKQLPTLCNDTSISTNSGHASNGIPMDNDTFCQAQFRKQLLSAYISSYIPEFVLGTSNGKPWLMSLPEVSSPTKALEVSTAALCTARLAFISGNDSLAAESRILYGSGLKELQHALWDESQMYRDETLAACMNLAFYELTECPGKSRYGYLNHHSGLATLVQLRGPGAFMSGLAHDVFSLFRVQAILSALREHRTTYLSSSEWIQSPWSINAKSPIDQLVDFFAEAPGLYLAADQLKILGFPTVLEASLDLIDRCWDLDDHLQQFFEDFAAKIPGPLYTPTLAKGLVAVDDKDLPKLFPVAFQFSNLQISGVTMWYWITSLLLWSGLFALYREVGEVMAGMTPDSPCPCLSCGQKAGSCSIKARLINLRQLGEQRRDYLTLAWNVCQSFEYSTQDCMLGLGPASMAAPLSIVLEQVKSHPDRDREVAWIKAALDIVRKRGMKYLGYQ
ncbi:uncharacterized protein KY384_006190 [Bacidia gigantensis]|uniref:uncharacterized protein n=1 Tax=Bacidia gigantensis TaxID=2732470 RepID=UPI001D04F622|nr:uncharacterized protein KY384_006190 [Bacidia gigantensis]KAG8529553.1 hypothetical protein KY384_006190 [Bacidia gigantensis]